jgi:Tol biopolymer transport system component
MLTPYARAPLAAVAPAFVLAGCLAGSPPSATPMLSLGAGSVPASASAAPETGSPTPGPTPVDASVAAGLALVRPVDGVSQVFVIDPDGSARQVSGLGEHASVAVVLPFWSPDRARIALRPRLVGSGNYPPLWVANADGTGQRSLETVGESISWSPESTTLLYEDSVLTTDTTGEPARLWLLEVESGKARVIGRGNGPAWLADGERISYAPIRVGPSEFGDTQYVVQRLPGGEPRPLVRAAQLWWSPDGSAMLLEEADGLYLADADGANQRRLLDIGGAAVWSPDGSRFAFSDVTDDGTFVVGVADRQGTVLWSGVPGVEATWSPDGTKLAIEVGTGELFLQILDAGTGEVIWELEGNDPAWASEPTH